MDKTTSNDYSATELDDTSVTVFSKIITEMATSEKIKLQFSNLKFSTVDYTIFGIMLALSGSFWRLYIIAYISSDNHNYINKFQQ
jgi:hypothetical protein